MPIDTYTTGALQSVQLLHKPDWCIIGALSGVSIDVMPLNFVCVPIIVLIYNWCFMCMTYECLAAVAALHALLQNCKRVL